MPKSSQTPNEKQFARIIAELEKHPGVTGPSSAASKRGFGSSALKFSGKIFAMLSSKGSFVVKLPRDRVDALVASGGGERFDPGSGRVMKEWLAVRDDARGEWLAFAREALTHVQSIAGASAPAPARQNARRRR